MGRGLPEPYPADLFPVRHLRLLAKADEALSIRLPPGYFDPLPLYGARAAADGGVSVVRVCSKPRLAGTPDHRHEGVSRAGHLARMVDDPCPPLGHFSAGHSRTCQ